MIKKCNYCGKEIKVKPSRARKYKHFYCSNKCRYSGRTKDIDEQKNEILALYKKGFNMKIIAENLGLSYSRVAYHFHKWGIDIRKCYGYPEIMKRIANKKTLLAQGSFMKNYQSGKISWRTAHKWASRTWGITKKPCEVCEWKEAERDMHLIIPRMLKRENAISLCPNCHRLVHRKKIHLSRDNKGKLLIVKI